MKNQFQFKLETNSWDDETFLYLTREYKDGFCLNENEIGVGKSDDPYRRWKEHNAASSKSTIEIRFEYIWLVKTKEYEKQLHHSLIQLGFENKVKEVFSGYDTNGNILTLEYLNNILKKQALDGPYTIYNGEIKLAKEYEEIKKLKNNEILISNFINTKEYNPALIKHLKKNLDENNIYYEQLAYQYKNDVDVITFCVSKKLINTKEIPEDKLFEFNVVKELLKIEAVDFETINNNIDLLYNQKIDCEKSKLLEDLKHYVNCLETQKYQEIQLQKSLEKQKQVNDQNIAFINNISNFKVENDDDVELVLRNKSSLVHYLNTSYLNICKVHISVLNLVYKEFFNDLNLIFNDTKLTTNNKIDFNKINKKYNYNRKMEIVSNLILSIFVISSIFNFLSYINGIKIILGLNITLCTLCVLLIINSLYYKSLLIKKFLSIGNQKLSSSDF